MGASRCLISRETTETLREFPRHLYCCRRPTEGGKVKVGGNPSNLGERVGGEESPVL